MYSLILYLTCSLIFSPLRQEKPPNTFDVIIDTDLGGDPDDIQSLFRAVHYSDILKIKGIISTPNTNKESHPWDSVNNVELIKHWIKRIDADHLRGNGYTELMSEEELLSIVKAGSPSPGVPAPDRSTAGSGWIIETARKYSKQNPLWILVWGSLTTTAQALHDAPDIAGKIRIYYISSSNTLHDPASRDYVYDFMKNNHQDLWWIENGILPKGSHETFRGVYQSGNQEGEWSFTKFTDVNIRDHGSDHSGMFADKCGDVFPLANYPENSLKEGDSPSLLYLLSPVIGKTGNADDPTQESWGGQFRSYNVAEYPNYYIDLDKSPEACQMTIGKWRQDFLHDWKMRWDRYINNKTISITIDDIPNVTTYPDNTAPDRLLQVLDSMDIPFTAFVNESRLYKGDHLERNKRILESWIENNQALIGNHTFSHLRYSAAGPEAFIRDVEKGELLSSRYALAHGKDVTYFRFPYNDLGQDSTQQIQLREYLLSNKYVLAPFTVESADWMFNAVYTHYMSNGQDDKAHEIGEQYVNKTMELVQFYENMSQSIYDRSISQIYLCHDNLLNADYLDDIIQRLESEGYRIISLSESLEDPVYNQKNSYYKKWGISWMYRWMDSQKKRGRWMKKEPDLAEIEHLFDEIRK